MNLKEILPHIETPNFPERLQQAIEEHSNELPLERCIRHGGWPEVGSLDMGEISDIVVDEEEITFTASVFFNESVPTGCSEINFPESVAGEISVCVDRTTGDVTFPR